MGFMKVRKGKKYVENMQINKITKELSWRESNKKKHKARDNSSLKPIFGKKNSILCSKISRISYIKFISVAIACAILKIVDFFWHIALCINVLWKAQETVICFIEKEPINQLTLKSWKTKILYRSH